LDTLTDLLSKLVAIDSVNPDLVPGGAGEARIAAFVADWCRDRGLQIDVIEPAPGRPSVVATARGSGGGRSLLLNAHMDTVGTEGMDSPHEPRVEGERLYGRGAFDMKAGLAAIMLAAAEAAERGLRGDVLMTAVADEEFASVGVQSVLERYTADGAIVTEPTALEACVAHRGFVWLEVETRGRAAHGSRPDLGIDAIAKMGGVLSGIENLGQSLRDHSHPLLGSGSIHASLIEGGQELSSYPERCLLKVERRTLPGEDDAEGELLAIVEGLTAGDPDLAAAVRTTLVRPPFEADPDEEIVRLVRRHGTEDGAEPPLTGHAAWMDAAFLSAAGIPTVVYGPGGEGAHAEVEWVDLEQTRRCAQTVVATAADFCS
jgi:acetylornithine deacetylase